MREITIIKKVAKFEELNEEQKNKVIERHHDINVDYDWYDCTYDDYKSLLSILGFEDININFSGFWSQGDGASFTAKFKGIKESDKTEVIKKAEQEYNNQEVIELFKALNCEDEESVYRIDHRYYHYNTITSDHDGLKEFAREVSKIIYKSLNDDYDYLTSKDAISEALINNEYEFDLDTLRIF